MATGTALILRSEFTTLGFRENRAVNDRRSFSDGSDPDRIRKKIDDYDAFLTDSEVSHLAEKVAKRAVDIYNQQFWFSLGFDLRDVQDQKRLQNCLDFIGFLMKTRDRLTMAFIGSFATGVAGFVLWAIWTGFKMKITENSR